MFIQSALPMEATTMTTPAQDSNAKSPPPLINMPWPRPAAEATPVITRQPSRDIATEIQQMAAASVVNDPRLAGVSLGV